MTVMEDAIEALPVMLDVLCTDMELQIHVEQSLAAQADIVLWAAGVSAGWGQWGMNLWGTGEMMLRGIPAGKHKGKT